MIREFNTQTATITTTAVTSGAIGLSDVNRALFKLSTNFVGATVSWLGGESDSATFATVVDSAGAAVTTPVTTSSWHQFPSEVMGLHSVKIVAASSQTAVQTLTIATQN